MIDILRMVRGAVADKAIVQALTHFFIYNGRLQGTNSRMAIDAPIAIEGSFAVPADRFIKAIDLCTDAMTLAVANDHLVIRDGRLSIKLPTIQSDSFPRAEPDPPDWEPETPLLPIVAALLPFTAADASQVWPMGVWIEESGHAYATNNICLVRMPCDFLSGTGHSINLPGSAIEELVRIGREPTSFGVANGSVTFHYDDGAWLKTQLIDKEWPIATLEELYRGTFAKAKIKAMRPVPDGLREAIDKIIPFCENTKFPVIMFGDGMVATEDGASRAEFSGFDLPAMSYNANMIALALSAATHLTVDERTTFIIKGGGQGILAPLRR